MDDAPQPFDAPVAPVSAPGPRIWTVFALFAVVFVMVLLVAGVVITAAVLRKHDLSALQSSEIVLQTSASLWIINLILLLTETALVAASLIAAALSPVPLVERLRLRRSGLSGGSYGVMIAGMLGVSLGLTSAVALLGLEPNESLRQLSNNLAEATGWSLVMTVLIFAVGPGFGEELLCRGYIQTRLSQRWGALPAIGVTSVLFGLLHLDPLHSSVTLVMGLYLGFVAERCGSLWPAIVCHGVNNLVMILLTSRLRVDLDSSVHLGVLAVSAVTVALCSRHVLSVTRPPVAGPAIVLPDRPAAP